MTDGLWLTPCPEPGCVASAEFVHRDRWDSTDGPVETIRTRCLVGHVRDSHPTPVPLGRDLPCPHDGCGHVHRWMACEDCGCPAHPLSDDVEP